MVCTDISEEMIRLMRDKIDTDKDYHSISGNKSDIQIEELPDRFDLEDYLRYKDFNEK